MERMRSTKSLLEDFPVFSKLPASWFMEIWDHYDENDNGYIEGEELNKFFKDLVTKLEGKAPSDKELASMKEKLMKKYDKAGDGRISLEEMTAILPTDENFILLFRRDQKMSSSVDLMALWRKYDVDKTGFINASELKTFIKDWITRSAGEGNITDEKLDEYVQSILVNFVKNNELSLHDMARLLDTRKNFLLEFENAAKGKSRDDVIKHFEKVFSYYDKSQSGYLEDGPELDAFVKDFFELAYPEITVEQIDRLKKGVLDHCDLDADKRISKKELALILINAK